MQKWEEYALCIWDGSGRGRDRWVEFTHQPRWEPYEAKDHLLTLRHLGDEGWDLVGVVHVWDNKGEHHGDVSYFKRRGEIA